MKNFKNLIRITFIFAISLALVACSPKNDKATSASGSESTSVAQEQNSGKKVVTVTTSFLQDMVYQLAKDDVDVQLIIPAGEDPHLYHAKPADLEKLSKADLVLYHGLHFEGKMVDVLEKKGVAISKNFPKDKIGKMEEDGATITDPHFWFDISLYKKATEEAATALMDLLPDKKDEITKNRDSYLKQLDELDEYNKKQLSSIPEQSRYLVTPHDAFNYFSRAYNIKVVAPQGVSTDSEVSNADIEKTANLIVEHKIKAIFSESTTNPERMKKLQEICKSKGFEVEVVQGEDHELFSDSLAPKGQHGDTYIDMYKHNIDLIVSHLK